MSATDLVDQVKFVVKTDTDDCAHVADIEVDANT